MGHGAVGKPSVADRRYVAIEGDRPTRRLRFLAKLHLGIDPDTWDALPWHRQRMYAAGLANHLRRRDDDMDYDDVATETGTDDDDLSSLGITMRTV